MPTDPNTPAPTPTADTPPPAPTPTNPPPAPPASGTVDDDAAARQAELDRVAAKVRAEEQRKLTGMLGMSPEEAKAKLDAQTQADLDAMSEADRKLAEAAKIQADAEQATAAAAVARVEADLTRALLAGDGENPGLDPTQLSVVLDMNSIVETAMGEGDDSVKRAVELARERVPQLFGANGDEGSRKVVTPPPPARRGGEQPRPNGDGAKSAAQTAFEAWQSRNNVQEI